MNGLFGGAEQVSTRGAVNDVASEKENHFFFFGEMVRSLAVVVGVRCRRLCRAKNRVLAEELHRERIAHYINTLEFFLLRYFSVKQKWVYLL